MFNVCPVCGMYEVSKTISHEDAKRYAVCSACGFQHPFLQLPLFVLTGASGTGKSACALTLAAHTTEYVVMETDILWDARYNTPDTHYREYREMWLRLAKNISQSGKPVILCGTAMPDQVEPCLERRYFSEAYYLALTCSDEEITKRLTGRPSWRESGGSAFLESMVNFNRLFRENGNRSQPNIDILDTTGITVEDTARTVLEWVRVRARCHVNGAHVKGA